MVEISASKKQFISALLDTTNLSQAKVLELESRIVEALLDFGSETEDNVNCVDRIGIRKIPDYNDRCTVGLALKSNSVLVSDILNHAEGSSVPQEIRERFPKLKQEDWDAVLRLATLVFSALEGRC